MQSLTEKIEMQSRSDLKLNELNKKQQDIEQRENKLKEKSISVRVREEENAKKEKTLSDWNAVLKLGFDEVKKRQTEMDEEVKKEAEEITAHHKLRLTKEYCNKLESMKNSLEETKRLWLSEHNMQMILLGVLAIYSFAITFFHGLIWNP